jgi:uncharacterized YceG family protein
MRERTAEERERDREERARRRVGAAAELPSESEAAPNEDPPEAPPDADAVPHDAPAEIPPDADAEMAPAPDAAAATDGAPAPDAAAATDGAPAPDAAAAAEAAPDAAAARAVDLPLPPPSDSPPRARPAREAAAGAMRERRSLARSGAGARSARAPRGRLGGPRLTRARGGALLALAVAVAAVWFLLSLFQPFAGGGSGSVIVEIPKGSSSSRIGSILARDGVVSSGFFFELRAFVDGKRGDLHSGRYRLKRSMSYAAAIDALSKPPPAAIVVRVVIPEGYTRMQIAKLTPEDNLSGSYLDASRSSSLLNPAHYGAPRGTPSLEGFLFPATYELSAGTPAGRLVSDQLIAFRQRFGAGESRRARALHVTPYQMLTVASMIEREAQTVHDRPLIAAVIYNRLRQGIPLGIDATIYYAVELQKGIATYTQELTSAQTRIDSPYNTRIHKGLPPTPISNPGMASIEAAAHPARVSYLYYVAAADGCGEQAFSSTYAAFQVNVAAYQAAVKKNGGRPPTCKKK